MALALAKLDLAGRTETALHADQLSSAAFLAQQLRLRLWASTKVTCMTLACFVVDIATFEMSLVLCLDTAPWHLLQHSSGSVVKGPLKRSFVKVLSNSSSF